MVNSICPPSLSQIHFWFGLAQAFDDEPRLNRQTRERLLDRRDRLSALEWRWASNGNVSANAVQAVGAGGRGSNRKLYIGRAHHQGSITPGVIDPKAKACCIAWGGDEHKKTLYEVLCTSGKFVNVSDDNTKALLRATSAGMSENGEPLFIGRVEHEGAWLYGKVQRSHGVCYVPYQGKETAFKEYQVFVADLPSRSDSHYWFPNEGDELPENAFAGGSTEGGQLYVGRAKHRGSLTPGSISTTTKRCHLAWGSDEHQKPNFDVLCNCRGRFVESRDGLVPVGAVRGGHSEYGEPLFVGRVKVKNHYVVGKVQPSHAVCYIAHQGKEVAYKRYQILVLE